MEKQRKKYVIFKLVFLFFFLPAFLVIYILAPKKAKNGVLLGFSLAFYAFGGLACLLLLLAESAAAWLFGLLLVRPGQTAPQRKRLFATGIVIFLAVLVVFKYTNFFLGSLAELFGLSWHDLSIILPLGISFYTFRLISYLADIYTGKMRAETNFAWVLLYACLFHTVLQGPIARYTETRKEIQRREMNIYTLGHGMVRFVTALAMKVILADHVGEMADALLPVSSEAAGVTTAAAWAGSLCFSLQMYLDFAAYSSMAIGLGEMIGFHYPENFRYPYIAITVRDFWRRWHITLSQFFRDYVYIPLGGSREGMAKTTRNLLVVWILTGFWHGANWNFILWGLFHFVFIFLEHQIVNFRKQRFLAAGIAPGDIHSAHTLLEKQLRPVGHVLGHIYTIFIFNFGWLLFRFEDFSQLGYAINAFFGSGSTGGTNTTVRITLMNNIFFLALCVLACTPFFSWIDEKIRSSIIHRGDTGVYYALKAIICAVLFLLAVFTMAGGTYTPFLYNQF